MKNLLRTTFVLILIIIAVTLKAQIKEQKPIRMAIAGMTHDHIGFILGRKNKSDLKIVGIYEPDRALADKYARETLTF